jgi:hypothetical protein
MQAMIDRYLDGDLTDEEAEAFLNALRRQPELEAELREYERMLAGLRVDDPAGLSAEFTDRVMQEITAPSARRSRDLGWAASRRWMRPLAVAASIVLVFGIGFLTAHIGPRDHAGAGDLDLASEAPVLTLVPSSGLSPATAASGASSLCLVRLVYMPQAQDVTDVSIAGTFNGWNPASTPMQREGNLWTALLLLPADTYEYMFVEDGQNWITDPLALQTRDDGFGRQNAVLDLAL